MLTIRQAQFAVLSQLEVRKFEDWMLVHLKKFFPRQCAALGETQLRDMVQHGIEGAAGYGLNFDTDRRFPWAGEILGKRRNPGVKMQMAFQAAKLRLRKR
jgi:hypothetical protein